LHQTIIDSVSHELRTPLTGIIGAASALRDERIAAVAATRSQLAEALVDNAQRLNRVVGNLLDMSRLSSGVLKLSRDWHDVNDLVAFAMDSNQRVLAGREVTSKLQDGLPFVRVDFHLFEQAIGNLLVNAATHTPAGSPISISGQVRRDQLELSVLDSGSGIPEKSLPYLFDRFYRVPGTAPSGTGTGLAIVKAVVELHGGRVEARNRPEGGAAFTITLPVEPQPEMPREMKTP
jgi:two-component system sensor histidine kinase KdpD